MLRLNLTVACPYHVQLSIYRAWSPQYPRLRRAFATSAPRLKKSKSQSTTEKVPDPDSEKPVIRWYQQLLPWSTKRVQVDPKTGLAGEAYDEAKELQSEIDRDDAYLRAMEGAGGRTMVEPILAALPKEDAQKIRAAIREEDIKDAQKEQMAEVWKRKLARFLPKKQELEIIWALPPDQDVYLKTLNANILKASTNFADQNLRKKLWQSYARCKAFLPPFLHLIPHKSWNVLWASQQTVSPDDPHWAPHMIILSEDMMESGKELDVYQRLLYIEALRHQDHQELAIDQWKELKHHLGNDIRASEEHELLGVRLFASQGDPEKAERIALNFLGPEKQGESRILIPILNAWIQRGDDIGIQHAWALYLRFRTQMGSDITMDDYDDISLAFLNVGRTDIALAVFKDMMLTGQTTDQGSIELFRKSMAMIGRTQASAITVADLNRISMTGLITLPRRFQTKFFYGSWLKKLIGMGEVNAAAAVVELMYERGVKPDSRHLNGIIGAWLRTGAEKDRDAAEKMAWAMIHERLNFVNRRRQGQKPQAPKMTSDSGLPIPLHLRRTVAPANIETFSLLLQHYGRRAQDNNIQIIQDTLEMAEIQPNTYFVNRLLYIDLRRGQHQAAWIKYKEMFGTIKPDLETYACLWDCEKAHIESLVLHSHDKFPGPRRIMSDMMNWFSDLSTRPGERESVKGDFSNELYCQIVRCMGLASDLEGIIVALYALRESFGFYPDTNTLRMVNLSVSRMKVGDEKPFQKPERRKAGKNQRKANAAKIAQIFEIVAARREVVLKQHGLDDYAVLDDDIQREEALYKSAEFLRTILRRTTVDEDLVEGNIEKAAWEMGVSGVRMEDPLPSYPTKKAMFRIE